MISRNFVTAGNATFTIENGKGKHFTFRVRRGRPSERYPNPALFVSGMLGRDNESSFAYMGLLDEDRGLMIRTRASRISEEDVTWKVVRFALDVLWNRRLLPAGYSLRHSGRCGRCGRKLTHPDSLDSGIGPECSNRMKSTSKALRPNTPLETRLPLYA